MKILTNKVVLALISSIGLLHSTEVRFCGMSGELLCIATTVREANVYLDTMEDEEKQRIMPCKIQYLIGSALYSTKPDLLDAIQFATEDVLVCNVIKQDVCRTKKDDPDILFWNSDSIRVKLDPDWGKSGHRLQGDFVRVEDALELFGKGLEVVVRRKQRTIIVVECNNITGLCKIKLICPEKHIYQIMRFMKEVIIRCEGSALGIVKAILPFRNLFEMEGILDLALDIALQPINRADLALLQRSKSLSLIKERIDECFHYQLPNSDLALTIDTEAPFYSSCLQPDTQKEIRLLGNGVIEVHIDDRSWPVEVTTDDYNDSWRGMIQVSKYEYVEHFFRLNPEIKMEDFIDRLAQFVFHSYQNNKPWLQIYSSQEPISIRLT